MPVWVGRVFLLAGRKEGTVVKPRWRLWNMHDSGSCVWEEWVEVCWGGGGLFTALLSSCSCGVEWGEKCGMCFMSVYYCFTVLDNFSLPIFITCLKIHKGSVICSERDCKDISSIFPGSPWISPWFQALLPEGSILKWIWAEAAVCMLWAGMHCPVSLSDLEFNVCPYLLVCFVVRGYVNS